MTTAAHPRRGAGFWIGLAAGWAVMVYGFLGFASHVGRPLDTARWLVATALAHDTLVAPLAVLVGLAVAALVPRRGRGPVMAGLVGTAVVLGFSYPLLRGFGRRPDNPSILPLDYARNVAIVVGLVWITAGATWWIRRRRTPAPPTHA